MFIHAYMPNTLPDILDLERKAREELDRRAVMIHRESVGFITLARQIYSEAKPAGHEPTWSWAEWCGLYVGVHLKREEGFDAAFPYWDAAQRYTANLGTLPGYAGKLVTEPDPDDHAAISRRAWTFRAGHARFTLMAHAHSDSPVCKRVVVGQEPVYQLQCDGSALSAPAAAPVAVSF